MGREVRKAQNTSGGDSFAQSCTGHGKISLVGNILDKAYSALME